MVNLDSWYLLQKGGLVSGSFSVKIGLLRSKSLAAKMAARRKISMLVSALVLALISVGPFVSALLISSRLYGAVPAVLSSAGLYVYSASSGSSLSFTSTTSSTWDALHGLIMTQGSNAASKTQTHLWLSNLLLGI
ncbi:hypothetical protein ABW21_db0204558 [Orbilia brochopaga]|nr:hypothetical protein ABW21_db0204558 [Drechslerella brochopaga]